MVSRDKYSFKNLELWQAAQEFAVDSVRMVDGLPNNRSADVIGRQLIRSATSIAGNIAEGHGRYTLGAYGNHLSIAKGSASESQGWIDMLVRLGHVDEATGVALEQRCDALIAALTRRIVALERQTKAERRRPSTIREDGPAWELADDGVPRFQGSKVPGLRPEEDDR